MALPVALPSGPPKDAPVTKIGTPFIFCQGLGATLYEMTVGTPPFAAADETGTESFDALVVNVVRLDYQLPDSLSIEIRQLIDAMLQVCHPTP
jgi:hypothetical protein